MQLPDSLAAALRSLTGSMDLLEAAAERRIKVDAARTDLEDELNVMAEDRTRLARELDGSLSRCEGLAAANAEVSRRLDQVSRSLDAMLAAAVPGTPQPDAAS